MRFTRDWLFTAALAGLAVMLSGVPAEAASLRLTANGTSVQVDDQDANDASPELGVVTFVGSVGNFTVNTTVGATKPLLGSPVLAHMDLNSINVSDGMGTLVIEFTETDFTGLLPFEMEIGGVTAGTVTYSAYLDPGNGAFEKSVLIGTLGPFSSGPFEGSLFSNVVAPSAPYSLTQVVTVTHGASTNVTSFNATLRAIPEPGTACLALLGLGICGVSLCRRRREDAPAP